MELIADLHIHSHYSRATSTDLTFEQLARWAQLKGVQVVGTGDIAHPGWLAEMQAKLVPAEDGLFRLKDEAAVAEHVPAACRGPVRFLLAGEISNIYKRHAAVRKVHNVVFAPSLAAVVKLQTALEKIGNIRADGRPILGLDSRDLLEIVLEIDERCALIPAHIWTPWFSMLGSKSGFDSVEACFGDLTPHIFALETGLSSDPPMNWRVSALDGYTLVSNSDAHSPQKLAREATVLHAEPAYDAIFAALRSRDPSQVGTLEFFPEEGKYHLDGHRKCGVVWEPSETAAHHGVCPVCGKPVTLGVLYRVAELADRPPGAQPARLHPFTNLVPLPEVLGEVYSVGAGSRRVQREYEHLLAHLGPELAILRTLPPEAIAAVGGDRLAEAIRCMRRGEVVAAGGYDGEYGVIRIFAGGMPADGAPQMGLFAREDLPASAQAAAEPQTVTAPDAAEQTQAETPAGWTPLGLFDLPATGPRAAAPAELPWLARLNAEQRAAVECIDAPLAVVAGPGAGKTRTLTVRTAHLIHTHHVDPAGILAITFTNKAAEEMAERLADLLGPETTAAITVKTFHAFGLQIVQAHAAALGLPSIFAIAGEDERRSLLRRACQELGDAALDAMLAQISQAKNRLLGPDAAEVAALAPDSDLPSCYRRYQAMLAATDALDFDDLVWLPVRLLEERPDALAALQARYRWIAVDEYQDVNLAQVRLLRLLAGGGANLCVIGDPDQAIYGFRGADHRYFQRFQDDYPGARTVYLHQSYRAPQSLLDAASQVIAHAADRPARAAALHLWSDFTAEVKLDLYAAPTDRAEAETVVQRIEQMVGGTSYFSLDSDRVEGTETEVRGFADFAVLYRLNAQARLLEEAFARSGIPYQVVGQTPLTGYRDVRAVLALLWLAAGSAGVLHLDTLLAGGRGALAAEDIDRVAAQVAAVYAAGAGVAEGLAQAATLSGLAAGQQRRVARLAAFYGELAQVSDRDVAELVRRGQDFLGEQQNAAAGTAQAERAAKLRQRAAAYGTRLSDFLADMALQREQDGYDPRADRVTLMTLHAAKGLEFPVVFMVGCEEGLLPYLPPGRATDLEEERRLFYVGMTRARHKLILTHARRRVLYGQRVEPAPSRFVDDIEAALKAVQAQAERPLRPAKREDVQLSLF